MAITREDIETVQRLLASYAQKPAIQTLMSEVEYIAWQLGDLPRSRAARLIIAARQNVPTAGLRRRGR